MNITSYHEIIKIVPEEIAQIINSYVDPDTDYYNTKLSSLPLNTNVGNSEGIKEYHLYLVLVLKT